MGVTGEKNGYWPHHLKIVNLFNSTDKSILCEINNTSNKQEMLSKGGSDLRIHKLHLTKLTEQKLKKKFNELFKIVLDIIEHGKSNYKLLVQTLVNIRDGLILITYDTQESTLLNYVVELMARCEEIARQMYPWKGKSELDSSNGTNEDLKGKLKELVLELKEKINQIMNIKPGEVENQFFDYLIKKPVNVMPKKPLELISLKNSIGSSSNPTYNTVSKDNDTVPECENIARPEEAGVFEIVETLGCSSHVYVNELFDMPPKILKKVTKEVQILQKSLPAGIWVKTFEDRMDLFSVLISGPEKTPYASGLFIFDIKIPNTYPREPPFCHYYNFCDGRLNPNLYEGGKVCLSLLGIWDGDLVEKWSPDNSNLLQLLVSIQGLILGSEPYLNEPNIQYLVSQNKDDRSRQYNEITLIKVVQSMTNMLKMKDTTNFKKEILEYVTIHGPKLINTTKNWMKLSERKLSEDEKLYPGYPLLPLTKGGCLSINKALKGYKDVLTSKNIMFK